MPAVGVALLAVALAAVAALARPRAAFAALVSATVLLPDTLALPTGLSALLTVHLLVTVAALGGVLWRTIAGRSRTAVWRPTAASLGVAAYLFVAVVVGVAFASGATPVIAGLDRAVDLLQQLGVLVAATALIREDGRPREFVAPVVIVLLVSTGVGLVEHVTGQSWGHFLFSKLPSQAGTAAATPLQIRGGQVRVRAGADFSLSYAWVLVALLPLLLTDIVRRASRSVAWIVPGGLAVTAVLLAVYWSGTRSALLGLAVVLLIAGGLSGRPRVTAAAVVFLVVAVVAVVALPVLGQHFSFGIDQGSVNVRQQRIPEILQAVSGRPMAGLGLAGLSVVGLSAVDSTFLLVYGETGALGLAALLAAFLVVLVAVGRGLRARDADTRMLVAACLAGTLAVMASGLTLDSVDLPSVIDVLWELAAIGMVAGEVAVGPARLLRPVRTVSLATAAAGLVGGAVAFAAPTQHASTFTFLTLPPILDRTPGNPVTEGNTLIATSCGAVTAEAARLAGELRVTCRNPYLAPGEGQLELWGSTPAAIRRAEPKLVAAAHRAGVQAFGMLAQTGSTAGRPTGLETLPASLAVFVAITVMALPLGRRERAITGFRIVSPTVPATGPRPLPA